MIIICGSVPPLKPFWDRKVLKKNGSSNAVSRGYREPGSHSRGYNLKHLSSNQTTSISSQTTTQTSHTGHVKPGITAVTAIEVQSGDNSLV